MSKKGKALEASGVLTSGHNISFWTASVEPLKFTPLQTTLDADVVIVGGGISGLTTAYCLVKSGRKVVVLEDGYIGSGETGRTTAHIVNALDDFYSELEKFTGMPMRSCLHRVIRPRLILWKPLLRKRALIVILGE